MPEAAPVITTTLPSIRIRLTHLRGRHLVRKSSVLAESPRVTSLHTCFGYCIINCQRVDAREGVPEGIGPLNRIIANSVPFMPRPLVGRIGRRYAAGEEIEDAIRV